MENLKFIEDYQKDYEDYITYVEEYNKSAEEHFKNIDANIKYLQSQMNCVLTEQEKQRYEQMTMTELIDEMLKIQKENREILNRINERWGK